MSVLTTTRLLERYDDKTLALRRSHSFLKRNLLERTARRLADALCAAYPGVSASERIALVLGFNHKPAMLGHMFFHAVDCIDRAEAAFKAGKDRQAVAALKAGIVADTLLDGRVDERHLLPVQDRMISLAAQLDFDLALFSQALDISLADHLDYARAAHRQGRLETTVELLGRLLKRSPALERNDDFMALAVEVTGKTPTGAAIMLSDGILRKQFLEDARHRTASTPTRGRLSEQIAQRSRKPGTRQRKAPAQS